jgi:hypothetical protein
VSWRCVRSRSALIAPALLAILVAPSTASAHGLVGKQDLPIPQWLFAWTAAIVLIVSFVGLAVLWPEPRIARLREHVVTRVPRLLEPLAGAIGVTVFAVTVYAGLRGLQNPQANLAPTMIFVIFWVGIPFASVLFGDVFAAFNPWRAVGRATGWLVNRTAGSTEPLPYPTWLGRWPAALGILAFAWVELVYTSRDDPSALAILALVYFAVSLVGMSLFGERAWSSNADAFGVYFRLFARLAPLRWRDHLLVRRMPGTGIYNLSMVPGTLALILVSIGTTSFDGFSQGTIWSSLATTLVDFFSGLGLPGQWPIEAAFTVGLVAAVAIVTGLYFLGIAGMRTVDRDRSLIELARTFGRSLVPIAFAYVFAHYVSLLVFQGQALGYLASDPLGDGSNLLGTASSTIDYGVLSANLTWYLQVGALLIGHVTGLVLAHDRALTLYGNTREAMRSQYWMLAVMVGFTSLALWLLSVASQQ